MSHTLEQVIRTNVNALIRHRFAVVITFAVISTSIMSLGLIWPVKYSAYATVIVDQTDIIEPLTEGMAAPTSMRDFAGVAREMLGGRKIMTTVLEYSGWLEDSPSPIEQERIIEKLRDNTTIKSLSASLIKIEYEDVDPERAASTANKLAELFVEESISMKDRESKEAFDFINEQAEEYHQKLVDAENNLKEFRSANIDAQPGAEGSIAEQIDSLKGRLERTRLELKEAQIRKRSLQRQLEGEAEHAVSLNREGHYYERLSELDSDLNALRLKFHDTHPDIIRIIHQMNDLKAAIATEKQNREEARKNPQKGKNQGNAGQITVNPLYQQLRRQFSATQTEIETLGVRLEEIRNMLDEEMKRGQRVHMGEATLAELTRDYEVNRDIYQELLRRRENARVSMNLDRDRRGLNVQINESAVVPLRPNGLRFLHFVIGGLALGILVPIGFCYMFIQLDPRVRYESSIVENLKLPVVALVPHLVTGREARWFHINTWLLVLLLLGSLAASSFVVWLRLSGVY